MLKKRAIHKQIKVKHKHIHSGWQLALIPLITLFAHLPTLSSSFGVIARGNVQVMFIYQVSVEKKKGTRGECLLQVLART